MSNIVSPIPEMTMADGTKVVLPFYKNLDNIRTIPCPDNIPGCLVLHLATEEVVAHPAESKNISIKEK